MLKPEEIRSAQFIDTFIPVIDGVVQTVHNYALNMNRRSYSCVVCPKAKAQELKELVRQIGRRPDGANYV